MPLDNNPEDDDSDNRSIGCSEDGDADDITLTFVVPLVPIDIQIEMPQIYPFSLVPYFDAQSFLDLPYQGLSANNSELQKLIDQLSLGQDEGEQANPLGDLMRGGFYDDLVKTEIDLAGSDDGGTHYYNGIFYSY